jgi:AcrR family transcriptional regulator
MITYHFGTKDQLWREAVRDMFATIEEHVNAPGLYDEDLDPVERFRQQMRRYTRYCAQHPEHARITIAETISRRAASGMDDRGLREAEPRRFHAPARSPDGIGALPRMQPESLHYAIVGMAQLPFVLASEARIIFGYDFTDDAAIERHADAILALLLRQSEAG